MIDQCYVAGKQVCKLMLVEINGEDQVAKGKAKQSNKYYDMYEQNDGTFIAVYGRVDNTRQTKTYPMSKWDSTYKSKTKRYKDITHLFEADSDSSDDPQPAKDTTINSISDTAVRNIIATLQSYATTSIRENYTISAAKVTQAMVDEAQTAVDSLSKAVKDKLSVDEVNQQLLHLYHIIPRKMDNVNNFLLSLTDGTTLQDSKQFDKATELLGNEQSTLDVMAGQVHVQDASQDQPATTEKKSLLDLLGITIEPASLSDIDTIKRLMGDNKRQFKAAFKVSNIGTQIKYDKHLSTVTNKDTQLFWHGSRNQNWLNILSTGLLIRPSGAVHTGSMFGDGIYFSNKCQKSIGYTSLRGSYWTRGSDEKAYLALFSVHVGNQKHITHHDSSCYKLSQSVIDAEGFDSVYAHGGADLRNDEFIIYTPQKCTISFLVEISS